MNKIFNYDVERNGVVAWRKDTSLSVVKSVLRKNTPLVTRMSYEVKGALYDLQIRTADEAAKGSGYISIKNSDKKISNYSRYGGYRKVTGAYFFLVEHTEKKGKTEKRIRTIEAMPLYLRNKLDTKEKIQEWCADTVNGLGLIEPDVRLERIKVGSHIRIDGYDLYLTGRTGNQLITSNGVQFKPDRNISVLFKNIKKYKDAGTTEMVTSEECVKLYEYITERINFGIYSKRINSIGGFLDSSKQLFAELDKDTQCEIINNLIVYFSSNNQGVDLRKLGGSPSQGIILQNKKINGRNSFVLVNESATGLFTNEVDLLTV